VLTWSI
jgi:hypothetical protein